MEARITVATNWKKERKSDGVSVRLYEIEKKQRKIGKEERKWEKIVKKDKNW